MAKRWIVTAVDYGDDVDGKARVLAACKTEDEAKAFVRNDIEEWLDNHAGQDVKADFSDMSTEFTDYFGHGCEWNIEPIDVPLD